MRPGVDFFTYANGGWLKRHPIPAAESSWGIGSEVQLELYAKLQKINKEAMSKPAKMGSDEQKVGDFWRVAMDADKAEKLGLAPVKPALDRIDATTDLQSILDVAFSMERDGMDPFFAYDVSQDEKQSDAMSVHLWQGGLGLPERDFYFNPEAGVAKIRKEYVIYIGQLLKLAGVADPDGSAAKIMAFETSLAKVSRKLEDLREAEQNYHKMPISDVTAKLIPSIQWQSRLASVGLRPKLVIVGQPEFFTGLQTLLSQTPLDTLKAYLKFNEISAAAPYLNAAADAISFHFEHQVLNGQKEPRPRWKRALDSENRSLGFVLGRIYVKDYFPPVTKKRYSDLVEAFREAYSKRIDRLSWMSVATKAQAHLKLDALHKKVGFPDHCKDYSKLEVGTDSYYQNILNASRWRFDDMVSKYGKPVDRTEWDMTPQTYNAYYNASNNEIVLPAASFDIPGITDADLDDAVIYGYAGASTIGHEMTHGFDDEGRKSDLKGNLTNWWTKEDAANFEKRTQVLVDQFNAYQPLPGLHINGKASLGENLADYGGLLIGLDAFKKTEQYKQGKKIDGQTPLQRFFLAYAYSWMQEERTESLRRQLLSDVHAPAKWRVIGPMSNIPAFFEAFNVKPGDPMRRPDRLIVHVW